MQEPPGLLTHYPNLIETISKDPAKRTELNICHSDATLIFYLSPEHQIDNSQGTLLTQQLAKQYHKPLLLVCLNTNNSFDMLVDWLAKQTMPLTLNIAGPRESESPGIYQECFHFLRKLLSS